MPLTIPDRRHLAALLLLVASVYFATFTGITSSNDGSHYALVRALVDHRQFEISDYLSFTEDQDYSVHGDLRYSDRPPGTALWTAPFFALATIMPAPAALPPSKHDPGNPHLMGIAAAIALAAALAVGLFWMLLRQHLALGRPASTLTALTLAFGTVAWKYGSVLYSHSTSALAILTSLYLALWLLRWQRLPPPAAFAFGFALGSTVLMEYTNAVFIVALGAFMLIALGRPTRAGLRHPATRRGWLIGWGALLLGGLLPTTFLLWYNTTNFGGPFIVSTTQVDLERWPQNENLATNFATPLLLGLRGMLFWSPENNNQGLLLLSPITWLALPGIPILWRQSRRDAGLLLGLFAIFLLLFSKSTTYNPYTNDGRYLTPFLALWLAPLALWIEHHHLTRQTPSARLLSSLALFGLFWLSVRNIFMHIAFSWNYDLHLGDLLDMSTPLPNISALLGTVLPNAGNLWWLWLLLAVPALLVWALTHWRSQTVTKQ